MQYNTDYSHFWDLLFYKIRFLNRKPIDSAKIPYEVRLLWTPALHSLDARSFIAYYLGVLTVSAPGFFLAGKKAGRHVAAALTITGTGFFLLSLFFFRLIVFNAFIFPVGIGFTACAAAHLRRAWSRGVAAAVLLAVFAAELNTAFSEQGLKKYTENFPYRETRSLTRWMELYAPQASVFLANFTLTPSLLYYGKRAIVTQPQYEDAASRRIIKDYIQSLFGEQEESFYRFCLSNQVDYFVFSRGTYNDTSRDSFRYIAGKDRNEEEAAKTVAFRFERDRTRLAYFGLCYEDAKYCVFRVITPRGMEESSRLFRQARDAFSADDKSPEGLALLYRAFLENPQNIAVRLMMNAKQKRMKGGVSLPHGY
jgi:hypothetical protein